MQAYGCDGRVKLLIAQTHPVLHQSRFMGGTSLLVVVMLLLSGLLSEVQI